MGLVILFLLALPLGAAEFNFEIRADNDTVLASGSITTTNAVLQRIEDWRLEQLIPDPANPGETILKYPTRASIFKAAIAEWVRSVLMPKPTVEIQAELDKIAAARQAIADLKEQAAQ